MNAQAAIIDELLDPITRCLTPEAAKRISELRASPVAQAKIEELAAKSSAGTLSEVERAEYDACVATGNFIAILQSKARKIVQQAG